jgi:Flp pilus assembly protein TadB
MMLGAFAAGIAVAAIVLAAAAPPASLRSGHREALSFISRIFSSLAARRRRDRSARHVLETLQATHAALRSGLPLPLALRNAVDGGPADARAIFGGALRAFDLNIPLDDALRAAASNADRRTSLGVEALALLAAEQLAASRAAAVLGSVCDRLGFEERLVAEVGARTGGLRSQMVLLAVLVPVIAGYLVGTVPGVGSTLTSTLGTHVLIPAALLFEILGIVASRGIIRSVRA